MCIIQVGDQIHYWRDEKLFIFDDTLQHQSCNESEKVRYCMFVDILRPSLFPRLMSGILAAVRMLMTPYRAAFYQPLDVFEISARAATGGPIVITSPLL